MKRILLGLGLWLALCSGAFAQNTTCSDRPATDQSNACANTRFVAAGIRNAAFGTNVKVASHGCAAATGTGYPTSDTTAIQCQINYLAALTNTGGFLLFPCGTYYVPGGITVKNAVSLIGEGRGCTAIQDMQNDEVAITFDTSVSYSRLSGIEVDGYQNAAATHSAVVVATNRKVDFDNCVIFFGSVALRTSGVDGHIYSCFIDGYAGGVLSDGANWYVNAKLDHSIEGTSPFAFKQTSTALAENHFVDTDFSGSYTNSIVIDDGGTNSAITVISGGVIGGPVTLTSAGMTSFVGAEFGSTTFTTTANSGSIEITGSKSLSGVMTLGTNGTFSQAGNTNIKGPLSDQIVSMPNNVSVAFRNTSKADDAQIFESALNNLIIQAGANDRIIFLKNSGATAFDYNFTGAGVFSFYGSIQPSTDGTLNSGVTGNRWLNVATKTVSLGGATSGDLTVKCAAICGANTVTLPAGTTDFSATGGTGQFVKQASVGGALTVSAPTISEVAGLGTGVGSALAVNVGTAGSPVVNGGVLGTPSSGTATNLTGLPTTGLTGTLQAAQEPAHTGDVTNSAGSLAMTLAAGNAGNLNSGTLLAARMPALTGDCTTSAGAVATTCGSTTAWTPTDASGAALTFASVTANYYKIGKLVTATFRLTYPATGSGATATIGGLPVANYTSGVGNANGSCWTGVAASALLIPLLGSNATTFIFIQPGGASPSNTTLSGAVISCTVSYFTN